MALTPVPPAVNRMDDLDRIFRRLVQVLRASYPQYLSAPFNTEELYQVVVPYRHHRQELGIETNQDYEMALMRLLSGERGYLVVDRDMRESLTAELESSNPDTSLFRAFNDRTVTVAPDALAMLEPVARQSDDARMAAPAPTPRGQGAPPARTVVNNRPPAPPPPARGRSGGLGTPPAPSYSAALPVAGMPLPPAPPPLRSAAPQPTGYDPAPEPVLPPPPPPPRAAAPVRPAPSAPAAPSHSAGRTPGGTGHGAPAPSPSFTGFRGGPTHSPAHDMASTRRTITAAALGGRCRYCSGTLPDGRQLTFCPHCGQDLTVQQCPACSTELELGWKFCTTCGRGVAQS